MKHMITIVFHLCMHIMEDYLWIGEDGNCIYMCIYYGYKCIMEEGATKIRHMIYAYMLFWRKIKG